MEVAQGNAVPHQRCASRGAKVDGGMVQRDPKGRLLGFDRNEAALLWGERGPSGHGPDDERGSRPDRIRRNHAKQGLVECRDRQTGRQGWQRAEAIPEPAACLASQKAAHAIGEKQHGHRFRVLLVGSDCCNGFR
jgi:hypothetical protein